MSSNKLTPEEMQQAMAQKPIAVYIPPPVTRTINGIVCIVQIESNGTWRILQYLTTPTYNLAYSS